jgi:hypothetical protein
VREYTKQRYERSKKAEFLADYDLFAGTVPGFSFNRQNKIGTGLGFFCSILAVIIILPYAMVKMIRVVN